MLNSDHNLPGNHDMVVITFVLKFKAKNGNGMNNVLQNGGEQRDADRKILKKYPGATILEVRRK